MNDRVPERRRVGSASERRRAKNMRRAEAKRAAARAAAARRRKTFLIWAGSAVVTMGLIFGIASACGTFSDEPSPAVADASSTPAGQSSPGQSPAANPALATKPTVQAGTGELTKLVVTPLVEGTGPALQSGQTVSVNYVGVYYKTGEEFDSSWRTSQPFSFRLGTGGVIKGWDEGLVGVKVGSRVQLDIPAELAYGDQPSGGRPAGPLRFVVDVISAS